MSKKCIYFGDYKPGLMGKAAPEAVVPLIRDQSGRLGLSGARKVEA